MFRVALAESSPYNYSGDLFYLKDICRKCRPMSENTTIVAHSIADHEIHCLLTPGRNRYSNGLVHSVQVNSGPRFVVAR